MKLIDDKLYSNKEEKNPRVLRVSDYQAAYACDNNIIKLVKIHTQHNFGGGYWGFLQIQKTGLDASLESIKFLDGVSDSHIIHSIDDMMMIFDNHDFYSTAKGAKVSILERFGKEFKPLFDANKNLKEYIPTHFSELIPYLK
ncbi:MAG: hypothetical protein ACP5NW_04135 [Candidatus Woesearchaeota archaeon]